MSNYVNKCGKNDENDDKRMVVHTWSYRESNATNTSIKPAEVLENVKIADLSGYSSGCPAPESTAPMLRDCDHDHLYDMVRKQAARR